MAAGLLRNLAVVALLVALTNASVILEEEETIVDKTKAYWDNNKDELMAHTALMMELGNKLEKSYNGVEKAAGAMVQNFWTYFEKSVEAVSRDVRELAPHFVTFYRAIPAPVIKKLVMDMLRTAAKQNKEHCGDVDLEYNPLHPGLTRQELRKKRETEEKMTLAKFGQAISTMFTDVDNFVVEYISKSIPMGCKLVDNWLERQIAKGEEMDAEEFKATFFN